jgi:hypothetical protein
MTITRKTPGQPAAAPATPAAAPATPNYTTGATPGHQPSPQQPNDAFAQPDQLSSLQSFRGNFGRMLTQSGAGESVVKLAAQFNTILTDNALDKDIKLIVLDRQTSSVTFSCLVLSHVTQAVGGEQIATMHIMVVEGSAPKLGNRQAPLGNGLNAEIPLVPGDIQNAALWTIASNAVQATYSVPVVTAQAGLSVIPAELAADDYDHCRNVLSTAIEACSVIGMSIAGVAHGVLDVGVFRGDGRVQARVDYNPAPAETAAGLPVRSDLAMDVVFAQNGQQNDPFSQDTLVLSSFTGFIDLIPVAPEVAMPGHLPKTAVYMPQLVLTNLFSANRLTIESQLLALAAARALGADMGWGATFNRKAAGGMNFRDIGAIGLDVPVLANQPGGPSRIDTRAQAFDAGKLYELLSLGVHPELMYRMDIPESSEMTWIQSAFSAAATNSEAYNAVIQAANNLTKGCFNSNFPGGPITYVENQRTIMGYYIDKSTQKMVSLATIDYLAVLNYYGDTDMATVREFDATYDPRQPIDQRIDKRLKIIKTIVGNDIRVTGYATPTLFLASFIDSLASAVQQAGLTIQPSNLQWNSTGDTRRTFGQFSQYTVASTGMPTLFQPAWTGQQQQPRSAQWGWGNRR